jgi:hypothetical protein
MRDQDPSYGDAMEAEDGTRSPLEAHSSYRGEDWSPERLVFHQNLEQFAERVGLIVGLQGNGKITQEEAYDEIRQIWQQLQSSRDNLLKND